MYPEPLNWPTVGGGGIGIGIASWRSALLCLGAPVRRKISYKLNSHPGQPPRARDTSGFEVSRTKEAKTSTESDPHIRNCKQSPTWGANAIKDKVHLSYPAHPHHPVLTPLRFTPVQYEPFV